MLLFTAATVVPLALVCATEAFATEETFEYRLDDGSGNIGVGPPSTFDADMLWGNYFYAEPGFSTITELSVGLNAPPAPGSLLTLYLFDDPDDDGDPTNAVPVAEVSGTPTVFSQTGFNTFAIEPTTVSGGFFVAANAFARRGTDRPARLDPQGDGSLAWLFYDGEIDPTDLGASPFFTRMDNAAVVPFSGVWMIRATAVPAPGAAVTLVAACVVCRGRRRA